MYRESVPPMASNRFRGLIPLLLMLIVVVVLPASLSTPSLSAQSPTCQLNGDEAQIAGLMENASEQNRRQIICDPLLIEVARQRANDMAKRNYFNHVNPDGYGPNHIVKAAGYPLPEWWGDEPGANYVESIAAGYATTEEAWKGWMNSPSHRQHLLAEDPFFAEQTNFGIGVVNVPGSHYGKYYVVITAPPGE